MDSSLNYRHTQIHRGDLQRRAELHRLAAQARRTNRDQRADRPSLLAPPTLADRVQLAMARLRHHGAARPNPN